MPTYFQSQRLLTVNTPLPSDTLLLRELVADEAISRPFSVRLSLAAEKEKTIAFDKLLGQPMCAVLEQSVGSYRHFHGVCSRFSQGPSDSTFTYYTAELVPQCWLLSLRHQSRVFTRKSVVDILKTVLSGLDVAWELSGKYAPRDYCVQYRESDLDFASRLMEDEGIYYYFEHTERRHVMHVRDTDRPQPPIPGEKVQFVQPEVGETRPGTISTWEKTQELASGKLTLWDEHFGFPNNHLDASKTVTPNAQVGGVDHKLRVPQMEKLEHYDFPGGYAKRFDGVAPGGGDQQSELQKLFEDNKRTVDLRMQEEAASILSIDGVSTVRGLVAGYKFELQGLPGADGQYVLTEVHHSARLAGDYRSDMGDDFVYENTFRCLPIAIPFRPARLTPRPTIHGTQTAVVVGQEADEIFTDKYGRVKVQFRWDREGTYSPASSCWIRVATPWAGQHWGMIHIPRIGQEVVVAFEEGDPDRPLIVGSVYNANMMPPYVLPDNKTQSGIKSRSSMKGDETNFNEIRFEDKKGSEQLFIHAEKDQSIEVEHDETHWVGNDRKKNVDNDETTVIGANRTETVTQNESLTVSKGNRSAEIKMGNDSLTIKMGNQTTKLNLGASSTEAMQSIELKVGQNSVKIDQTGVTIKGLMVKVEGTTMAQVKSPMTQINGDAMLMAKGGITMIN